MRVVIIGGSGLIGSKLVARLREHGHEAVPASPDTGVNTLTGEGLAEVLAGAAVVVDVSNSPSFEDAAVLEFFETSTGNLLAAEAGGGRRPSRRGVGRGQRSRARQRLPPRQGRPGVADQRLVDAVLDRPLHAVLRVHQTHRGRGHRRDTVRIGAVLFQPIAAEDVAKAVARVAVSAPVNGIVEIAGPQQFRFDEFIRLGLSARHDPRKVVADPHARYFGAELTERMLVPGADARLGEIRFEDWLCQSAVPPVPAARA